MVQTLSASGASGMDGDQAGPDARMIRLRVSYKGRFAQVGVGGATWFVGCLDGHASACKRTRQTRLSAVCSRSPRAERRQPSWRVT